MISHFIEGTQIPFVTPSVRPLNLQFRFGSSQFSAISPDGVVYMKVGFHGSEALDQIVARKFQEVRAAGAIFWGYGGSTCHPINQVRPFVDALVQDGLTPAVVFGETSSAFKSSKQQARHFSVDGRSWIPMPPGIIVRASRYALVLSELREVDAEIDLAAYEVAVGPSKGRNMASYLRFRVDKACAVATDASEDMEAPQPVRLVGLLAYPYAVFVR